MNEEQIKLLEKNGYSESNSKPGLWYKASDGLEAGKVTFMDFRNKPTTYAFEEDENIPGDVRLLRTLKNIGDKNQRRFE